MKAGPDSCFHLTVEIVQEIHAEVIGCFGGSGGIRDKMLPDSILNLSCTGIKQGQIPKSLLPPYVCPNIGAAFRPIIDRAPSTTVSG
ncbi:MAG: hypothetical protein WD490_09350 [Opitutales bacterium]